MEPIINAKMEGKLYFRLSSGVYLNIMNKQTEEMSVTVHVYKYHSDTNYPTYLDRKYYFEYAYSILITTEGNTQKQVAMGGDEKILMITPDYRVMHETVADNIEMIRRKLGFKVNPAIKVQRKNDWD